MNKKKAAVLLGTLAVLAAAGGACYYYWDEIVERVPFLDFSKSNDKVYVEKVGRIMNQYYGVPNRYNGVVEAQDTYDVNVDTNNTIQEVLVSVGDMVEEGQTLVLYDTKEIELQQRQAELEYEGIQNEMNNYRRQIATLKAERDKVEESEKFSYTTEIQSLENNIEQGQFDLESKQLEIDKFKEQIETSSVVSKVSGVVRQINETGYDDNGNAVAFMKIQKAGGYRVKGSIDEQNVWTLAEGQSLVVRSRVDPEQKWSGTISKIDTDNTMSADDNAYASDSGESATKYPFYVELESEEGLLLGQHVYMELDEGQTEEKEGLWLYSYYIVFEEDEAADEAVDLSATENIEVPVTESLESLDPGLFDTELAEPVQSKAYVWAANEKNRLEKRYIELGQYDAELDEYEILSGLTEEDYIAWPIDGLYEGIVTVTNADEVDYTSPLYNPDGTEGSEFSEDYDMNGFEGESVYDFGGDSLPSEMPFYDESDIIPEDSFEDDPDDGDDGAEPILDIDSMEDET